MKDKRALIRFMVIVCLVSALMIQVFTLSADAEQKEPPDIYLWSKTDVMRISDEQKAAVTHDADAKLVSKIYEGLMAREINAKIIESDKEMSGDRARYFLVVRVDNVHLGFRGPFGRISKVKVSYQMKNKEGASLFSRYYEETSHQRWQNCVNKISDQIVVDVDDALSNRRPPKAEDNRDGSNQDHAGTETEKRLQKLEELKTKGMITQKEYEAKRNEILNEL